MPKLRLHRFISRTQAEGPGVRACLWVQGCSIHCQGCGVPWTWSTTAGEWVETESIVQQILATKDLEGITFLGGEPFEQAEALAHIAKRVRSQGLGVMTFSGHTLEQLRSENRSDWNELLDATDLLIDGPYLQDHQDFSRPWVGSSNQRYHFLTERYADIARSVTELPNRLEVRLNQDGSVGVNGMLSIESIERLLDEL